jgi:hypothetical protein
MPNLRPSVSIAVYHSTQCNIWSSEDRVAKGRAADGSGDVQGLGSRGLAARIGGDLVNPRFGLT